MKLKDIEELKLALSTHKKVPVSFRYYGKSDVIETTVTKVCIKHLRCTLENPVVLYRNITDFCILYKQIGGS
jgi:hypothetical protein